MNERKFLVIYAGWLGDLVWLIPFVHRLKTAARSVALVVSQIQAPLAEIMGNGLLDKYYVDLPRRRLASARLTRDDARASGTDTFVDLKGRGKTAIYMPWRGKAARWIPHRADAREYALSRLLHPAAGVMPRRHGTHMVDAYASVLDGLGVPPAPPSFALPFDDRTIEQGEEIVRQEGLRAGRCVALNIGSAQLSKIWPAGKFRRLAEILARELDCKVFIMGAKSFTPNANYDLQASREFFGQGPFVNLVERTSLAVDSYLLRSGAFSVTVGNDSFAGHMAGSATETASAAPGAVQAESGRWYTANHTISLFGPTNPVFCKPYDPSGAFNTIVTPASWPATCTYDRHAHTCPHYGDSCCPGSSHCMDNITVNQVAAAVEAKLQAPRPAPAAGEGKAPDKGFPATWKGGA